MNTPVPGPRMSGGSILRRSSTKACSGPSTPKRSAVTSSRPRNQVVMTVKRISPISSGTQAPWMNFVRFAPKKASSTQEQRRAENREPERPLPAAVDDDEEEDRRDRDRAGHPHPESEGELRGALEGEHPRPHS